MKSICNKIWNFLDFLILKNFSKFLENSREISLLDLDLEAFSIHFSLSISILRHFHFTFHSRSRYQGIFISLFILEMSEPDFHFTFHFSKWVNQISISLFTSRTSNIYSRRTLGCTALPDGRCTSIFTLPKYFSLRCSFETLTGFHFPVFPFRLETVAKMNCQTIV